MRYKRNFKLKLYIILLFQANLITKSTSNPDKYAPKFCLKLKFNCKLRSSHPCCKYPLPPREEHQESTTDLPQSVKRKVRPTRIQITNLDTTNNARNARVGFSVTSTDKNPWNTTQTAYQRRGNWTKGRLNIMESGNRVFIRTCWADGCATANRTISVIQAE